MFFMIDSQFNLILELLNLWFQSHVGICSSFIPRPYGEEKKSDRHTFWSCSFDLELFNIASFYVWVLGNVLKIQFDYFPIVHYCASISVSDNVLVPNGTRSFTYSR